MQAPDTLDSWSEEIIARGSKSFALASRLFDAETRRKARLLYAWCRYCDDQIDGQDLGHNQAALPAAVVQERLAALREQTHAVFESDSPADPPFEALRSVAVSSGIPEIFAHELLDGFAMDATGQRFDTFDDTLLYCYHVAGVVGLMMALIMGVEDEDTLHRGIDLGLAFQLTNISRDVLEDARNGRVYLPRDWLEKEGVAEGRVALDESRDAVFRVVERLLNEAEKYYASARVGISRLPQRSAMAILTARDVYRAIGKVVRRRKGRAWDRRARVSRKRKMAYAMRSMMVAPGTEETVSRQGLWTRPELSRDLLRRPAVPDGGSVAS